MTNDTSASYGTVTKAFHWGMALLIFWQMLKFFDRIGEGEHWVGQVLVSWHFSIGTLLLVLVAARIVWVARQRVRPAHDPATAFAVRTGHVLLYACMVLLPVTGILVMVGGGFGLTAFGTPLIAEGAKVPWAATLGSLHSPIAWLLLVLTIGHAGMALRHHFVKRDGILQRII